MCLYLNLKAFKISYFSVENIDEDSDDDNIPPGGQVLNPHPNPIFGGVNHNQGHVMWGGGGPAMGGGGVPPMWGGGGPAIGGFGGPPMWGGGGGLNAHGKCFFISEFVFRSN